MKALYAKEKTLPDSHPSSTGHVEPGVNQGGPSPKAKYYLATDSEQVRRLKNEKYPVEGSEIVPETIYLQSVGAQCQLLYLSKQSSNGARKQSA